MNTLQSYLDRGWRFVGARQKGSDGLCKVKCPNEHCGLSLAVESRAKPSAKAVNVEQMADLSVILANRRYRLGLTADDIDDCAGLGHRHVQKVEDAGRNIGQGKTISSDVMLGHLMRVLDEGLTPDNVAILDRMIATRLGIDGKAPKRPRVPNIDTVLLIVQALGGRLIIDWGKPPRMTQRLIKTSGNLTRKNAPV